MVSALLKRNLPQEVLDLLLHCPTPLEFTPIYAGWLPVNRLGNVLHLLWCAGHLMLEPVLFLFQMSGTKISYEPRGNKVWVYVCPKKNHHQLVKKLGAPA